MYLQSLPRFFLAVHLLAQLTSLVNISNVTKMVEFKQLNPVWCNLL
jgi:hypothetical protein